MDKEDAEKFTDAPMYSNDQLLMFFELARRCSLDIGRLVKPEEIKRYFSISILKLGDPTWAFERFNTEEVADIVATIIKETDNWTTTRS